jgi:hypothetical protein
MKRFFKRILKSGTGRLILNLLVSIVFKKATARIEAKFPDSPYKQFAVEALKVVEKEVQDEITPDDL